MFFFRRPPASPAAAPGLPPTLAGKDSARPLVAKQNLPTLHEHGAHAWEMAKSYAAEVIRTDSDVTLAATLILRVSRDFEIVRLRKGREVPVRHPAFGDVTAYINERGKIIPFEKVLGQALINSKFDKISLYPENGELTARSPSGRWRANVAEVIPKPWYTVLVMVGKGAMAGRDLDRYSYHAKVHLLGEGDPLVDNLEPRMMTQRHRLKRDEMRLFKGNPNRWQDL